MIYQVRVALFFEKPDAGKQAYETCLKLREKAVTINPGGINEEVSTVVLIECHHDESPLIPCKVVHSNGLPVA